MGDLLLIFSTLTFLSGDARGVEFQPDRSSGCGSASSPLPESVLDVRSSGASSVDLVALFSTDDTFGLAGDGVKSASSAAGGLTFSVVKLGSLGGVNRSLLHPFTGDSIFNLLDGGSASVRLQCCSWFKKNGEIKFGFGVVGKMFCIW